MPSEGQQIERGLQLWASCFAGQQTEVAVGFAVLDRMFEAAPLVA